jgi:hypothetical protein
MKTNNMICCFVLTILASFAYIASMFSQAASKFSAALKWVVGKLKSIKHFLRSVTSERRDGSPESSELAVTSLDVACPGGSEPFMLTVPQFLAAIIASAQNVSQKKETLIFLHFQDWVMEMNVRVTSLDVSPEHTSEPLILTAVAPLGAIAPVAQQTELPEALVMEKTPLGVTPALEVSEPLADSVPLGAIAPKSPLGNKTAVKTAKQLNAMTIADLRDEIASEIDRGGNLKMPPKKAKKQRVINVLLDFYKTQK